MALLPPFTLDTVVAIGVGADPGKRQWVGTGFIYGKFAKEAKPGGKSYQLWLVTNKHVLGGLSEIFIKFNSSSGTDSKDYSVPLKANNGRTRWVGHPTDTIDVAAIFLNAQFLKADQRHFHFFRSDDHTMTRAQMKAGQITEGDRIFVLGFPMGMVDSKRQYVICRSGALARVRDFTDGHSNEFLGDVSVFPGNSGGPVIICPSSLSIQGTKQISKADLIGIVKSYVPYQDIAISQQTRRPRMVFEENSGLTAIESVDSIIETVDLADKRIKGRAATTRSRAKKDKTKVEQDSEGNG